MHQNPRSPSIKKSSQKVYDYLIQQPSNQRQSVCYVPKQPALSPYSKQQTQYELIVQFELRREKEKTIILQQRLKNKQSFIKQMKEFQDELTLAFEKCQQQLLFYKTKAQQYEVKFNSLQSLNANITLFQPNDTLNIHNNDQQEVIKRQQHEIIVREYLEEIAELKHLVIRLEEEINYHQKIQKKFKSNKKNLASSMREEFYEDKSEYSRPLVQSKKNQSGKNKAQKIPSSKSAKHNSKQRSKTLANEFVAQKQSQNFINFTLIQQFIEKQNRKIASFINHFLTMCQFFDQSVSKQPSIKHKLKKAWKWVKSSIVQWNYLKTNRVEKVKQYKIGNLVTKLMPSLALLPINDTQNLLAKILAKSS